MYEYRADLVRVVDGDTIHVNLDLGCDIHVFETIRLAGINAPEMSTPEGVIAKTWLVAVVGTGHLLIRTVKDKREKYGRYLGWLWLVSDGTFTDWGFATSMLSVNERMIAAGQAVVYP